MIWLKGKFICGILKSRVLRNERKVKKCFTFLLMHIRIKDRITFLGGVPDNSEGSAAGGTQEGQL
jgi:hypothetical protein